MVFPKSIVQSVSHSQLDYEPKLFIKAWEDSFNQVLWLSCTAHTPNSLWDRTYGDLSRIHHRLFYFFKMAFHINNSIWGNHFTRYLVQRSKMYFHCRAVSNHVLFSTGSNFGDIAQISGDLRCSFTSYFYFNVRNLSFTKTFNLQSSNFQIMKLKLLEL